MNTPVTLLADFYKLSHREQYPAKTENVYSVLTPRSNERAQFSQHVVVFGVQYYIKEYLIRRFNEGFFQKPKRQVIADYQRFVKYSLGLDPVPVAHLEALHDLGYLPIKISALAEGTRAPIRVPVLTIENTHPDFFWLSSYLETTMLNTLWLPMTSATVADGYRRILENFSLQTTGGVDGVDFQAHDFGMRGMSSEMTSTVSGAAHLLSFLGSDTIPAGCFHEEYYEADCEKAPIIMSIPATEHSVMCAYGEDSEQELFRHLLTDVYPKGFVSVVSDSWDFWRVVGEYLPALKSVILERDGRLVIRPDSGVPEDILCGTVPGFGKGQTPEEKGLIECLWDTFGGQVNDLGYKVLDPHIGAIYGDSITLERAQLILERLAAKGFASSNVVFGIGSRSYQSMTRDSFGFALKATSVVIDGQEKAIFKAPKTDKGGTKKSQKGRVRVYRNDQGQLTYEDGYTRESLAGCDNLLLPVFENGRLLRRTSLEDIRQLLKEK